MILGTRDCEEKGIFKDEEKDFRLVFCLTIVYIVGDEF